MTFNSPQALFLGAAGIATGVGGVSAIRRFREDKRNPDIGDKLAQSVVSGARAFGATAGVAALGVAAYRGRGFMGSGLQAGVDSFSSAIRDAERARPTYGFARAYGSNSRLMLGGGTLAGASIGAAFGHPVAGAAAGFGLGMMTQSAVGLPRVLKVPGAKTVGLLALSTLAFAGARALAGSTYQSESVASADNMGGYDTSTRDRMNTIGSSGDMVFGLHYGRH